MLFTHDYIRIEVAFILWAILCEQRAKFENFMTIKKFLLELAAISMISHILLEFEHGGMFPRHNRVGGEFFVIIRVFTLGLSCLLGGGTKVYTLVFFCFIQCSEISKRSLDSYTFYIGVEFSHFLLSPAILPDASFL